MTRYGPLRDTFRSRVYEVEDSTVPTVPVSLAGAAGLVGEWSKADGVSGPEVLLARSESHVSTHRITETGPVIRLSPVMLNLATVVHEYSHHLSWSKMQDRNRVLSVTDPLFVTEPGHGWLFCQALLSMLDRTFSSQVAADVRSGFDRLHIPYQEPAVPNGWLSPLPGQYRTSRLGRAWVVSMSHPSQPGPCYMVSAGSRLVRTTDMLAAAKVFRERSAAVRLAAVAADGDWEEPQFRFNVAPVWASRSPRTGWTALERA